MATDGDQAPSQAAARRRVASTAPRRPTSDGNGQQRPPKASKEPLSDLAATQGRRFLAWNLDGMPPGLGTVQWLFASVLKMPGGSAAALLATWTAVIFALWAAIWGALGSVILLLTGATASGHALGIATFTEHTGLSADFVGVISALFFGAVFGFADTYTLTIVHGIPEVAASLLIGLVLGVVITLVALGAEDSILRSRGYRRPSRREWETILEPALDVVKEAMGLPYLPAVMVADRPVPDAWATPRHIVVTSSLLTTLDKAELQAVLAHECAHWRRGDAITLRMLLAFSWPLAGLYAVGMALSGVNYGRPDDPKATTQGQRMNPNFLTFFAWLILWPSFVLMRFVVAPATAHGNRKMEYLADEDVVRAGLGGGLLRGLERLSVFEAPRGSFSAVMLATHPPMALRLERIEDLNSDPNLGGIEEAVKPVTGDQAGWALAVVIALLGLALSSFAPLSHAHQAHHAWWQFWKGW